MSATDPKLKPSDTVRATPPEADATAVGTARATSSEFSLGAPMAPGEVGVLGPYRVVRELGKGGMGAVYLAIDTRLDRQLALKVMLPEFAADPAAKERFIREAKAVARIGHDNVVTVYEADEREGVPYIAMQFLQGYPLDEFLKRKGAPPLAHCVRIGIEAARGLSAAHELGLVHRDIKPANLWLEAPNGRVKVLDFGLAKPIGTDAELTKSGAVVGTPAYMSPEQARGLKLDHRTDIFSLGTVMYRLLTGSNPFVGENIMAVLMALGTEEPAPIGESNPEVPEALASFVMRMLAKRPEARPQTATEVAQGLRAALTQPAPSADQSQGLPVVVRPVPVEVPVVVPMSVTAEANVFADLTTDGPTQVERPVAPAPRPERKRSVGKGAVLLVAGAVLLSAAVVAVVVTQMGKKGDPVGEKPIEGEKSGEKGGKAGSSPNAGPEVWKPGPAWKPVPVGQSPFDKLDPAEIPAAERFEGQSKELVAVIGTRARRLVGGGPNVTLVLSPDGKYAATTGHPPVVWDVDTQTEKWAVESAWGDPIGFAPDGKRLFLANGYGIFAYDITADGPKPASTGPDGKPKLFIEGPLPAVGTVAEGGRTLVFGGSPAYPSQNAKVVCYDIAGAEPKKGAEFSAKWTLSAAQTNTVVYLTPEDKLRRAALKSAKIETDEELPIVWNDKTAWPVLSPDGRRFAYQDPLGYHIWDLSQTPAKLLQTVKPEVASGAARFSPDGRWLCFLAPTAHLFRIDGAEPKSVAILDNTSENNTAACAFSADGNRAVVVSYLGFLRFWDLSGATPKELSPFDPTTAFGLPHASGTPLNSRGGQLTLHTFSEGHRYRVWSLTGRAPTPVPGPTVFLDAPFISPVAGRRWMGGSQLYELTGTGFQTSSQIPADVQYSRTSPDGSFVVVSADESPTTPARLEGYDISGRDPVKKWTIDPKEHAQNSYCTPSSISGDNRWLAVQVRKENELSLALWKNATTKPVYYATVPIINTDGFLNAPGVRYALSPDGRYLCHLNTRAHIVLDLTGREPREVARFGQNEHEVENYTSLDFYPDGKKVLVAGYAFDGKKHSGVMTLLDVPSGKVLWSHRSPFLPARVEFAHDGRHLFVHNVNRTVHVLRLPDLTVSPDRRAAEWVLSVGGTLRVNTAPALVKSPDELPAGNFLVTEATVEYSARGTADGVKVFRPCTALRALNLKQSGATDEWLGAFVGCTELEKVHLTENPKITDAGLLRLTECARLWELSVANTQVTGAGLGQMKCVPELRALFVGYSKVSGADLALLARASNLELLDARGLALTDDHLASVAKLGALRELQLKDNPITDAGLARLGVLSNLRALDLRSARVTDAGVKKLAAALPACKIEWDGGVIDPAKK